MVNTYDFYVASCSKTGGIYHYKMHDCICNLVDITRIDRPMYMLIEENRLYVLIREAFENKESGLIIYDIDEGGKLVNPSNILSTRGEVACHLCVDGTNVYCTNYISGSVIKMPKTFAIHSGHGIYTKRQNAPHPHYVCMSPDNKYVFVTDLGLDKIFVYYKDLTLYSIVEMPAGHGPRHLVLHPDGQTVYCVNELKSSVSVLHYAEGKLILNNTVSTLPNDFQGSSMAAAIRYTNHKIYITNRGHNSIAVFDEELHIEKHIFCGGDEPRDIWITDDAIICANQFSDNVCFISTADDSILYRMKMNTPVCVICRK